MKILLSIPLVLIAISFASCKKEITPTPVPVTVLPKVKTETLMNGATVLNTVALEYDNTGRRLKVTYMDGTRVDYNYYGITMTQEQFNAGGISQNKYTLNLNADGLSVSYFANASPNVITYQTFSPTKQLLYEVTKNNGVITYENYHVYDNLGNVSSDSLINSAGTTIRTYEYYTDNVSTITNNNFGDNYDGIGNRNCTKKVTSKSPLNVITSISYSIPELDAQGRVIKQSYTYNGSTTDYLFTYY